MPRLEDPAILRGAGRYVADAIAETECLYGTFVRSPVAAARLLGVRVPGGVQAFTAKELAGVSGICPTLARPDFVPIAMPVLAVDEVRFSGEPVALVLAASQAGALDAAERVELELEPRKPVLSVADATKPGAPAVHDVPFPGPVNTVVNATLRTPGF
jgi:carbon-monoxide dehydrogenase large subunit